MRGLSQEQKDFIKSVLVFVDNRVDIEKIADDILWMFDVMNGQSKKKQETFDDDRYAEVVTKMVALTYSLLSLEISNNFNRKNHPYMFLLQQLSNTIVAIIRLIEDGLEYQAMILLRCLLEQYMILLVVTESPEIRSLFAQGNSYNKSNDIWKKYFTKSHFIEVIERYGAKQKGIIPPFAEWVKKNYKETSSFLHNDYVNLLGYSFSVLKDEEQPYLNIWGEYVTRKKMLFGHLLEIIGPAEMLFITMIRDPNIDISLETFCNSEQRDSSMQLFELLQNMHIQLFNIWADSISHK